MARGEKLTQYLPRSYDFYRKHYHHMIILLMVLLALLITTVSVVLYQMFNRPLPAFMAIQPDGKTMSLTAFEEPNLLPDTILRWAVKAATASYTFDFSNYRNQLNGARPYFTPDGWQDYLSSVEPLINNIVQNQLFVNSIVAGTPVISNQGPLPGKGYVWRVQIPFLVAYLSTETIPQRNFLVILTIVRVPTTQNPQGIGIDQFVMVNR